MRDYWLSKLFFDLQNSPPLGDEYRANRKKILDCYPLKPEVRTAVEGDDLVFLASRVNPYLLRYYFTVAGMSEADFLKKVRTAGADAAAGASLGTGEPCTTSRLIIRGWKDVKPENQKELTTSLTELGKRIKAARPDVLIEIAPDHWVNFFINNLPSICVGMGEEHEGPAEPWMKDCPFKKIAGHPKLANHILQTAFERDFEPSVSHHLTLDHGFCIPLWRGGLDPLPPSKLHRHNDLEPPYPSARRCLQWERCSPRPHLPEDIRVAILATGASHSDGKPTMAKSTSP
jgi:hypothetical protein